VRVCVCVRTNNTSSLECLVHSIDEVVDTVIAVWNHIDERYLLSVDGRRRNQPKPSDHINRTSHSYAVTSRSVRHCSKHHITSRSQCSSRPAANVRLFHCQTFGHSQLRFDWMPTAQTSLAQSMFVSEHVPCHQPATPLWCLTLSNGCSDLSTYLHSFKISHDHKRISISHLARYTHYF